MKKLLFIAILLVACIAFSVNAQESVSTVIFLEMEQTGLAEPEHVGVTLRVKVTSSEEAQSLKAELGNRFFTGLTYTAKLHVHRTDGPCSTEDL